MISIGDSTAGQGLHEACRSAADKLAAASEQVEAGLVDDHPKHHALTNLLVGLSTLKPVSKL